MERKVEGKRLRGRQRWIDSVNDDLNKWSQRITIENSIDSQMEKCSRGSGSPSRTLKAEEEDRLGQHFLRKHSNVFFLSFNLYLFFTD